MKILKVVLQVNFDTKGFLSMAINDPNPVLFFEHKCLCRNIRQDIPTNYYMLSLGKASVIKTGDSIITSYGAGIH